MRNIFNLSVIATFLLIGFSVFYYFVIFLPQKEKDKEDQYKEELLLRQQNLRSQELKLDNCLSDAYDLYKKQWDSTCKLDGHKEDCTLPKYRSDTVEEYYKGLKEDCFKKYPQ